MKSEENIKNRHKNNLAKDLLCNLRDIIIAVLLAMAIYKGLGLALGTKYPLLVVVSGSMIPTLHRGDLIIVKGVSWDDIVAEGQWKDPNSTIIVYYSPLEGKLIVHRAYKKIIKDNYRYLVTWGDNNPMPDPWLIPEQDIVGKVIYHIRYIGYPRILIGYLLGEDVGNPNGKVIVRYKN